MEKSIFTKRLFFALFVLNFFVISLQANCNNRVFNINVVEKVSTFEVINQLSDACDFSVVIKDPIASKLIKKSQDGINIKNLTLEQIFEIMTSNNFRTGLIKLN
jgi:general secretion pathway protein D